VGALKKRRSRALMFVKRREIKEDTYFMSKNLGWLRKSVSYCRLEEEIERRRLEGIEEETY